MKVTNYLISKKLAEIGFKADNCGGWFVEGGFTFDTKAPFDWPSYDLETILDALPKSIVKKGSSLKNNLRVWFDQDRCYVGYQSWEGFLEDATIASQNEESLADTVARLLLLLVQKGLLTFNK